VEGGGKKLHENPRYHCIKRDAQTGGTKCFKAHLDADTIKRHHRKEINKSRFVKCIVEFHRVFHVQCGEAWKRTDAFFWNTFQLRALIVTTRVLPIVARTGVNFDYIVVRQEDVRRINLCVATPADKAFGQWLIPMGATMIPNIAKAGNIERADPL
jgi:hypothetical protein